jgi:hypothetical protein
VEHTVVPPRAARTTADAATGIATTATATGATATAATVGAAKGATEKEEGTTAAEATATREATAAQVLAEADVYYRGTDGVRAVRLIPACSPTKATATRNGLELHTHERNDKHGDETTRTTGGLMAFAQSG